MKSIGLIIACWLMAPHISRGQDQNIKDYLDAYIGTNAVPYVQPLADLFTSNINTGIWDGYHDHTRFYFRLKAQAIASYPSDDMRSFQGMTSGDFNPPQTVTAPTIIGDRSSIILTGSDTTFYIFPGGYELKRLLLGTPQLTIGGFLHSEISGRFLSFSLGQDFGKVNFIGIGARHFITDYFKEPPFDFSIGYFYHHITASTYLDSDQHLISSHIGKSGKYFSGQLMAGYQTSGSAIHYTYTDEDGPYDVDLFLENNNNWIFEASIGLRLGNVFICSALSYARHISLSVGAGLTF